MMKRGTRTKRLLLASLALAMLLGVFAGCGGDADEPETPGTSSVGGGSSTQDQSNTDDDSPENLYRPEQKDYNRDLTMLTEVEELYYYTYTYELETEPTEICDIAIYDRQNYLMDNFGINLVRLDYEGTTAYDQFVNTVSSGTKICDIACLQGVRSLTAAVNGWLLDVNQIDELNLEAPYWDQRIQEEYRIGEYLFTLEGDFNFIDDLRTYVTIYNDTMYSSLGFYETYGTPYSLSADGQWTYEMMMEMITACGRIDSNGDGLYDERDTWGLVSENTAPYYFFLGSGNKLVHNEGGSLSIAFNDPSTPWSSIYDVIEDIMGLNQNEAVIVANRPNSFSDSSDVWGTASNIFMYNRALFRCTSLSAVLRLLDMEDDYGIMPIPAYTEGQDGYYCWVSPLNHYPMSFPSTSAGEISEIAEMVEVMSYYSLYWADSLNVAFYDLLAYARLCRKAEDEQMLRLVFANKTYDIDRAMDITGAESIIWDISNNQSYDTLSSAFGQIQTSAEEKMRDLVNTLVANLARQNQ